MSSSKQFWLVQQFFPSLCFDRPAWPAPFAAARTQRPLPDDLIHATSLRRRWRPAIGQLDPLCSLLRLAVAPSRWQPDPPSTLATRHRPARPATLSPLAPEADNLLCSAAADATYSHRRFFPLQVRHSLRQPASGQPVAPSWVPTWGLRMLPIIGNMMIRGARGSPAQARELQLLPKPKTTWFIVHHLVSMWKHMTSPGW